MRHTWSEPTGFMEDATFDRVELGLRELPFLPSVFLGGFGEPLSHPRILDMVRRLKFRGATVEMITNGIALDEPIARQLVDAGLDTLWVSMDGATPESFGEVRTTPDFGRIVENLRGLKMLKWHRDATKPELGIAFVAMKKNKAELMEVMNLGVRLGATRLSVSNVQPYTEEMRSEPLFERSLDERIRLFSRLDLPRMDAGGSWNPDVMDLVARYGLRLAGEGASSRSFDACPFVQRGSVSIRWDGLVSPCLPLLHTHATWLGSRKRLIREHSFGSVRDRSLREIWEDPRVCRVPRAAAGVQFPSLHTVQQLRLDRYQPGRLPERRTARVRRLPLGSGLHSLPLRPWLHASPTFATDTPRVVRITRGPLKGCNASRGRLTAGPTGGPCDQEKPSEGERGRAKPATPVLSRVRSQATTSEGERRRAKFRTSPSPLWVACSSRAGRGENHGGSCRESPR